MKSSRIIYTVLVVQTVLLGYLVLSSSETRAMAQVPDQGAQLNQIIDQSKATNAKLDRILTLLESGKLQVVTVKASDASGR